jgi:hypothetical protein
MQTNSNRRGLAIGAAIALVGSFFGAAPASYAITDGAHIEIRPLSNAAVSNFGGLLTEDFPIYAQLKSGASNANDNFANGKVWWEISYVSGNANIFAAAVTHSATPGATTNKGLIDGTTIASASAEIASESFNVVGATVSNVAYAAHTTAIAVTVVTVSAKVNSSGVAPLFLRAISTSAFTSKSANVVVDVKFFIDDFGGQNSKYDSGEWFTTQRVTFYASGNLAPTVSVGSPAYGESVVTASATLTSVNWSNLNGSAFLYVTAATHDFNPGGTTTESFSISSALKGTDVTARNGVVSQSFALQHSQTLSELVTVSAELRYSSTDSATIAGSYLIGATTSALASAPGVTSLSISAAATEDITGGHQAYDVRANKTYTIKIGAISGSSSVAKAVTVTLGGTALVTSSRLISINGAASVANYPASGFTVTTGTNGSATFTIGTSGFVPGNEITIDAEVGNVAAPQVTLTVATVSYTVESDNGSLVATTPGSAVSIPFTVEDNWEEPLTAASHFLKVTRGGSGFNYATTVSYVAIANGAATVAFTPEPATATGSATVAVEVVRLDNTAYLNAGGTASVTVTVTSSALAFSTGLAASRAASVSYFADTVSWVAVTGKVVVPGSEIKVTADSTLVFRKSSSVPATTSGQISVFADSSGNYTFDVAGLRSGTKVMTLTNGTATTTSQLIVSEAASDMGKTIKWDTTTIEAGKTRVITGTLTDMNGNPVDTTLPGYNGGTAGDSGTASIVISYTGTAGIVVGTMPTETDVDGKFKVSILTAAADSGTLTLTAVYMPQGASTVTANKVTSVQAVTVAPAAAPEVNAVIGSFNGRWAVRVENAKGSVVSVKAGNRWVKFTSLNNNYLFSRKSVVGRTLAVSVWVDGELQNSQTITIK